MDLVELLLYLYLIVTGKDLQSNMLHVISYFMNKELQFSIRSCIDVLFLLCGYLLGSRTSLLEIILPCIISLTYRKYSKGNTSLVRIEEVIIFVIIYSSTMWLFVGG